MKLFDSIKTRRDNHDYFYVLDFGRFSTKAALLRVDKNKKEGVILKINETIHNQNIAVMLKNKKVQEELVDNLKELLSTLNIAGVKNRKVDLIVGISSELVSGHTFSYSFNREKPDTPLETRDLKNVIHNAELKAYDNIRSVFIADSGYRAPDVVLMNCVVQNFRIDGHATDNPVGKTGKELSISIFNAYMPKFYKEFFDKLSVSLKLNIHEIFYTPYAVFDALQKQYSETLNSLIIDVGASTTRISLARKGRLDEIKNFSFGGDSFTKRIMKHLDIGFGEAENVKVRYHDGELSDSAKKTLDKIIENEIVVFLNALEMILKDFSRTALLPADIYLYGGGANMPIINGIIKRRNWKKDLPFIRAPKIHTIDFSYFKNIHTDIDTNIKARRVVGLVALANYTLENMRTQELVLDKTLRRMVKLITS